jgi:hypothetical protein
VIAFLLFYWCVGGTIAAVVTLENSGRSRHEAPRERDERFRDEVAALLSLVADDD